MSDKRTVLVALDGSKNSLYAFEWFLNKCLRPGDLLIGYTAWQSPHLPTFSLTAPFQVPSGEWERLLSEVRKNVEKVNNDFTATCQGKKVESQFFDESSSKAGEAIVAAAEKHNANLIVIGTRGLSTLRRTVLGSVSDYVLHHTHCPVVVVPTPEDQAAESS